ncbi:MAG: ABC transporter ATP-binding protein [Thermoleophilia bacterium]|nr:ABC transporter ATP-binding protein [Thermoleophilia bacterium]
MNAPATTGGSIRLEGVARRFRILKDRNPTLKETLLRGRRSRYTEFWALRDVDLSIAPGESVGLVGRNGSGKSTLLKLIAGIIEPTRGRVVTTGTIASMLELGAGFHPDFSGRENLFLNAAILGFSEQEVRERYDQIVAFAELEDFIESPVRTYSSGMQLRLAFAVATHVRAEVMLLDEVFAVGDEAFQRKCMGRMSDFRRAGGTLVFVSHDPSAVERICDRAVLMESGRVLEDGDPQDILASYHRLLSRETRRAQVVDAESPEAEAEAEAPPATDPAKRWGDGAVEITAVRLLDAAGAPAGSFRSGDPMAIDLAFTMHRPVDFPNFGIAIHSVEGVHCYGTNMARELWASGEGPATGSARFHIPSLHLHEGRFTVTVAATSADERDVYDWLDRWVDFDVFAEARGIGLVDLSGTWEVRPAATA